MGKTSTNAQEILPEFQKYLLEKKLAPERNITFLAYWVSRFLTFGRKRDIATDDYNASAALEFLDILRADEKILDWQPSAGSDYSSPSNASSCSFCSWQSMQRVAVGSTSNLFSLISSPQSSQMP